MSYVHVGPRLASLLVQADSFDLNVSANETIETDMSEVFKSYSCLQELWHILNLSSSTTLLLCSNGLHSKPEFHNVPTNIILVEYGFQVVENFWNSPSPPFVRAKNRRDVYTVKINCIAG